MNVAFSLAGCGGTEEAPEARGHTVAGSGGAANGRDGERSSAGGTGAAHASGAGGSGAGAAGAPPSGGEPDTLLGRWHMITRCEQHDGTAREWYELAARDRAVERRVCSEAPCLADWECTRPTWADPGGFDGQGGASGILTRSGDQVWFADRHTADGYPFRSAWSLIHHGHELTGTVTHQPCLPYSEGCCEALVLGCSASAGYEIECAGEEFTGLDNCDCVQAPPTPECE